MKTIHHKSPGQVAILYAGALAFALCGAIALGADVSVMYVNWQHSQKTVDAAALAGSNYLNGGIAYSDPTTGAAYPISTGCTGEEAGSSPQEVATQVACTYAVKNGLTAGNVTITPTASTIQVSATETTFPYFFAKALGLSTYSVASTATAAQPGPVDKVEKSLGTSGSQGLFPIGLQCTAPCSLSSLDPGQTVTFGSKFVGGLAPGNWDWLDVGGTGASGVGDYHRLRCDNGIFGG